MKIHGHALDISLTTHCQARCRSCDRTNTETGARESWLPLEHMKLSDAKTIIDNFSGLNLIRFAGEYGDPLMYPHLTQVMDYAIEKGVDHIMLNTNGGLRKPEWFTEIGNQHQDRVSCLFGIDGIDHDTNWQYREGVDFDRAWANMLAFNQTPAWCGWQFIVFEHNWHQIKQAIRIAKAEDIHLIFIINCSPHSLLTEDNRKRVIDILETEGAYYDQP